MSDGTSHIRPGDRIQTNSGQHFTDTKKQHPHHSAPMIVEWVETKEDGTKIIWVRRP